MNAGPVDGPAHQSTERVDFTHEMALRRAADRRIARHLRDGVRRERADSDARAQTSGGVSRLAPGVARTDHDDVERIFHWDDI